MTWTQVIVPDPATPAEQGMCLQYVRMTFALPVRYGSATEAWEHSESKHTGRDYPAGVWFPVWWHLDKNVNGHVALVAPDGTVYSTSDLAPSPLRHHPSIDDVEAYYARYGMTLTYRGWTEDVAGYPVITHTERENDMSASEVARLEKVIVDQKALILDQVWGTATVTQRLIQEIAEGMNKIQPGTVNLASLVKAVNDDAAERMKS